MDGGNEQRVAVKFCFKTSVSATETLVLVQKAYGNEAVNRSNVFRWYSWFWDGRELYTVTFLTCLGLRSSHVVTAHQSGSPGMPLTIQKWNMLNLAVLWDWFLDF